MGVSPMLQAAEFESYLSILGCSHLVFEITTNRFHIL